MTFAAICSLLASVVFALSAVLYVIDVTKSKVLPSVATFVIFSFVGISQVISLMIKGVWHVVPFAIVGATTSAIISLLALKTKRFYFKLPDKIALIGASLGLIVWLVTKDAAWNIYILNAVNFITFMPLVIKSFKHPELESAFPWQLNLLASLLLVLGINSSATVVWILPIRQFLCSLLLNLGLLRGALKFRISPKLRT